MESKRRSKTLPRVGVKYCGGCNPSYDRTELLDALKEAFAKRIEWVSHQEQSVSAILIIAGCSTSCVHLDLPGSMPLFRISNETQYPQLVNEINSYLDATD